MAARGGCGRLGLRAPSAGRHRVCWTPPPRRQMRREGWELLLSGVAGPPCVCWQTWVSGLVPRPPEVSAQIPAKRGHHGASEQHTFAFRRCPVSSPLEKEVPWAFMSLISLPGERSFRTLRELCSLSTPRAAASRRHRPPDRSPAACRSGVHRAEARHEEDVRDEVHEQAEVHREGRGAQRLPGAPDHAGPGAPLPGQPVVSASVRALRRPGCGAAGQRGSDRRRLVAISQSTSFR